MKEKIKGFLKEQGIIEEYTVTQLLELFSDYCKKTNKMDFEEREKKFIEKVKLISGFDEIKEEFILYWTQTDGKKMNFELHKIFDIKKRLKIWELKSYANKRNFQKDSGTTINRKTYA